MENSIIISEKELQVKEFKGQRVVTFKDIDLLHERVEGTAGRNFRDNRNRFIEGVDYFQRNSSEAKNEFNIIAPNGLILITENGYLMLVKSLTDDLAWEVQRELVNNYFRVKEISYSRLNDKIFLELKSQINNIVNDIVKEEIGKVEKKCSNYYRPTHLSKYKISSYIKNKLGINKVNKEYELVKLRILIRLGANKWEDVPIEVLSNSMDIIDECIDVIKKDRNFDQVSLFDINKKMPLGQISRM